MASSRTISSTFQDRAFLNRARILNLYTNDYQITNQNNDIFIFISLNIRNATASNNNITFLKSDFDLFIWNDRQLDGTNNTNAYMKFNDEDKVLMIRALFDEQLGKYSFRQNNANTQINLMNVVDGKINLNTLFETIYDYVETDDSFTLKFKVNAEVKYDGSVVFNNIPDGEYSLISIMFDPISILLVMSIVGFSVALFGLIYELLRTPSRPPPWWLNESQRNTKLTAEQIALLRKLI